MKLNNQLKEKLKENIVEQLKRVPKGERVKLDKGLLEDLLFEEITYNKSTNETLKLPVWYGDFLSRLDLSEISFDNVAWSLRVQKERDIDDYELFDEKVWNKFKSGYYLLRDNELIDYSNTNIKLDFNNSWEAKTLGAAYIICCNFENADLSHVDSKIIFYASNSNFSNTGIKIDEDTYCTFLECNFEGVDLSNITIYLNVIIDSKTEDLNFIFSNLKNTGINITYIKDKTAFALYQEKFFNEELMKGHFDGCFINGRKIHSKEERQQIAYQKMKR